METLITSFLSPKTISDFLRNYNKERILTEANCANANSSFSFRGKQKKADSVELAEEDEDCCVFLHMN